MESQGSGTYTGIFLYWAEIWGVKFVCQYTDLQVNTDNVIVNMDFESVYDPQFLLDVDAATDYFNSLAGNLAVLTTSTAIKDTMQVTQSFDAIYVNGGDSLVAVSVDANGNITETVLAASTDNLGKTLVKGPDGQEYVVTNDGQVMGVKEYKATGGSSRLMKDHNSDKEQKVTSPSVSFSASTGQKYGFDAYTPIKQSIQSHYPLLPPSGGGGAHVPFKSVASFATDRVGVSATNGITFKDEMGIPALASGNDLTIRGSANGSTIGLYAYKAVNDTTEEVVGKLNIMSFDEQPKRLIIVPVNGATLPDATALQQTLNTIYAQAVTRWSVSAGNPITVNFPDGVMTHGGSSAFEAYNSDQKLVINAYANQIGGSLDDDALYLFFIDNVDGKAGVAGFMPLQRQGGFIYGSPNLNIVAHELGHGTFNLYHTFSSENYIAQEQTTDNLMDYKGGTELWKYQWEYVQDPQRVWMSWAQGESEGEMKKTDPLVKEKGVVLLHGECIRNCKWEDEGIPEVRYSKGFQYSNLTKAYSLATQISHFNNVLMLFKSNKSTIRIIESNMSDHGNFANLLVYIRNDKTLDEYQLDHNTSKNYLPVFNKWLSTDPSNYSLVVELNIYPNQYVGLYLKDEEIQAYLSFTLGHEFFIHYRIFEVVDLWNRGLFKDAIDKAVIFPGPNGGDFEHRDYIVKNKSKVGITNCYEYINKIRLSYQNDVFEKIHKAHDAKYNHLK